LIEDAPEGQRRFDMSVMRNVCLLMALFLVGCEHLDRQPEPEPEEVFEPEPEEVCEPEPEEVCEHEHCLQCDSFRGCYFQTGECVCPPEPIREDTSCLFELYGGNCLVYHAGDVIRGQLVSDFLVVVCNEAAEVILFHDDHRLPAHNPSGIVKVAWSFTDRGAPYPRVSLPPVAEHHYRSTSGWE